MRAFLLLVLLTSVASRPAAACEVCSLYNASRLQVPREGGLTLFLSEQYSTFERSEKLTEHREREGVRIRNLATTQLGVRYDFSEVIGLQLTLPFFVQRSDVVEGYRETNDSDVGLGDMTLGAAVTPILWNEGESSGLIGLQAGVKLPTGETSSLDAPPEADGRLSPRHHTISALSGTNVVFGSGSTDVYFGAGGFLRQGRFLGVWSAQYDLRTEGTDDYRFGDDLILTVAPGAYLLEGHNVAVALLAQLTHEEKASDRAKSGVVRDSTIGNLFLGPDLLVTLGEHIVAEAALDLPLDTERGESVSAAGFRVRASMSYRF